MYTCSRRASCLSSRPSYEAEADERLSGRSLFIVRRMRLMALLLRCWRCLRSAQHITRATAPAKTYRNPLLPDREIADPFVLRVDGKYYLYPTTDSRGYEVFVSDNLVHWERKARAFTDPRGGAWAPEVFHNKRGDGKFYLYYTDNMPGREARGDAQANRRGRGGQPPGAVHRQRRAGDGLD